MKEQMRKLVICVVALCVAMGVSIITMIYGWGVQPKNWSVIVPFYFFGQIFGQLLVRLADDSKK